MGLDGPVLIRAEWYRPLVRPSSLLPGHAFPCPGNGVFSKSVSWNKIRCEVQPGVRGMAGRPGQQDAPWAQGQGPGSGSTHHS